MKFKKEMLKLYAITDGGKTEELLEKLEGAIRGGVTVVQLREKNLPEEEYIKKAVAVKALCRKYGVPLIINDNVEVALKAGADGVHVGAEDTAVAEIRQKVSENFIVGATAKTLSQARLAEASGADYLGCGAMFPSPTKKNAIGISAKQLEEICEAVNIPVVAIGGITVENAEQIKDCNIAGIAVVSAIFGSDNPYEAARKLRQFSKEDY